ncbi:MAG: HD-GYP domain-containing protein, partial [Desulfobulbus sp.]
MTNIHRAIFLHLFWAWLFVSLIGGGIFFSLEMKRVNSSIIALAENEADAFSSQITALTAELSLFDTEGWRNSVLSLAQQYFVVIALYDRSGKQLTEVVNPRYADIEQTIRMNHRQFPLDGRRHFERMTVDGKMVVQILVPIAREHLSFDGYLAGIFVVDQATLERLNSNLFRNVINILLAIILTTVALYPIIVALNKDVLNFSAQLLHANLEMAAALGAAVAIRDSKTSTHNYRVTLYAIHLGETIGLMPEAMRRLILGAFLHDIGKIGISDTILLKPGPLEAEECMIMRTHVALGLKIIRTSEWLSAGQEVVANHHEMFNGKGYPNGLQGTEIPLVARIFSIVDVFDALSSDRPYKNALPLAQCIAYIRKEAGAHFDPELVDRFTGIAADIYTRLLTMDEPAMMDWLGKKSLFYFLPHSLKGLGADIFSR